jgi:hypothetical protein
LLRAVSANSSLLSGSVSNSNIWNAVKAFFAENAGIVSDQEFRRGHKAEFKNIYYKLT